MDETGALKKCSKKRSRCVESWQKNATKKKRNSGEAYVSRGSKKPVPEKIPPSQVN